MAKWSKKKSAAGNWVYYKDGKRTRKDLYLAALVRKKKTKKTFKPKKHTKGYILNKMENAAALAIVAVDKEAGLPFGADPADVSLKKRAWNLLHNRYIRKENVYGSAVVVVYLGSLPNTNITPPFGGDYSSYTNESFPDMLSDASDILDASMELIAWEVSKDGAISYYFDMLNDSVLTVEADEGGVW